jgi:hypothetical protein
MSREHEKARLLREFDALISPLRAIVKDPAAHNQERRERHLGEFQLKLVKFYPKVEAFTRSDPTASYSMKYNSLVNALNILAAQLAPVLADHARIAPILDCHEREARKAIESIPVD